MLRLMNIEQGARNKEQGMTNAKMVNLLHHSLFIIFSY